MRNAPRAIQKQGPKTLLEPIAAPRKLTIPKIKKIQPAVFIIIRLVVIISSLFQQIVKLMDLLCTKYMKAIITYEGIQRIETLPMPREALREALLNACINKDYAEPSPIQIRG